MEAYIRADHDRGSASPSSAAAVVRPRTLQAQGDRRGAIRPLLAHKWTLLASAYLLLVGGAAILAPVITEALVGVGPNATDLQNVLSPPYLQPYLEWILGLDKVTAPRLLAESGDIRHWFGTDQLGRDQLARLLYGGRISLGISFVAAFIATGLGIAIGAIAGYYGGRVDDAIMWLINSMMSIPGFFLLITVSVIFKPTAAMLIVLLGLLGWIGTARLTRGNVLKVKELEYVLAARCLGASNLQVMIRHVVPNSISIVIVNMSIDIGNLILLESSLSFLGLGVQPPTASWGSMLNRAQSLLFLRDSVSGSPVALHLILAPGILIMLTVLALYQLGDSLRDLLDPMMRN